MLSKSEWTTVIFRNVPSTCSRDMMIAALDAEGFSGLFDFVYVPVRFQDMEPMGHALVNMVSHEAGERVMRCFQGFTAWPGTSVSVPCDVDWSSPLQGLAAHVERYRDSPVQHESVPGKYKPALFQISAGIPELVPFPEPTKKLRAPRVRLSKGTTW